MNNQEDSMNLGQHQVTFDAATGNLSIFDEKQMVRLSADEAYRLLTWMQSHYSDRLYQETLERGSPQHVAATEISNEEIRLVQQAQEPVHSPIIDQLVQREIERQEGTAEREAESG